MIITNLKRVLKAGLINFWRNSSVSLASIVVITITLFVIGGLMASRAFLSATLDDLKKQVDVSVSFQPTAPENEILVLKDELRLLPEVKAIDYFAREAELEAFRKNNKDNALILQSLEEVGNPFGARLNITANDPAQYESIVKFLEAKESSTAGRAAGGLIDDISFKKDSADRLLRLIKVSSRLGLAVSLILIFMSVVVTFNTIALAIYVSREEISVMRLVGAEDSYIRGPFVIEGAIAGLLSALLSIALLYPAALWVRNTTVNVYGGLDLLAYYLDNFLPIIFTLVVIGIFLGTTSSFLAVKRYLKT